MSNPNNHNNPPETIAEQEAMEKLLNHTLGLEKNSREKVQAALIACICYAAKTRNTNYLTRLVNGCAPRIKGALIAFATDNSPLRWGKNKNKDRVFKINKLAEAKTGWLDAAQLEALPPWYAEQQPVSSAMQLAKLLKMVKGAVTRADKAAEGDKDISEGESEETYGKFATTLSKVIPDLEALIPADQKAKT